MDPVTVEVTIDIPREQVFEYLLDIASMPEYTDHFLSQWHLTRLDSYGRGAGARFHIDAPGQRFSWADLTYVEVAAPHRLVAVGRGGKYNRNKLWWEWRLDPAHGHGTHLSFSAEIEGALPTDRLMQGFFYRAWFKRNAKKAMGRLQSILEEGRGRGRRATVAGTSAPVGAADR